MIPLPFLFVHQYKSEVVKRQVVRPFVRSLLSYAVGYSSLSCSIVSYSILSINHFNSGQSIHLSPYHGRGLQPNTARIAVEGRSSFAVFIENLGLSVLRTGLRVLQAQTAQNLTCGPLTYQAIPREILTLLANRKTDCSLFLVCDIIFTALAEGELIGQLRQSCGLL